MGRRVVAALRHQRAVFGLIYPRSRIEVHKMKQFLLLILCIFMIPISARPAEPTYRISVLQKERRIEILKYNKPILIVDSLQFDFISPVRMDVVRQSAQGIELRLLYRNVPEPGVTGGEKDRTVILSVEKINGGWHFFADPDWANHTSIYLRDLGDHFFGIREYLVPDNLKSPDLRGSVQSFEVKGEGGGYHENYASAWSSFFIDTKGYGSYFDTFAKGEYEFAVNGKTEIYHHTGRLDWYIFTGEEGDKIVSSYYKIIGAPKYVPSWACGVTIWRDEDLKGKEDVLNDAAQVTALRIPITSIMVDRPYSNGKNGWSKMDFNNKFGHPGDWISELNNHYNIQFMTWVATCTFGDSSIFAPTFPGDHGYIDLSDPSVVSKFGNELDRNQYSFGVRGHKMDRGDEVFPEEIPWHDGTPAWERRNKYPYLFAKVIDSMLTAKWGKDEFNYARGALGGSQKYLSALWGGDVRSSWDGMASNLANSIRCGFMGFPDWGSDVGGYLGIPGMEPEKLFSRWLEWGAWCGLFEIKIDGMGAQGADRAPWHYTGDTLRDNFRRACEQRMELAPYVYSQLNTSGETGVLMKPLAYSYMNDTKTYDIWNEYLFGQSFLVAPVTNDASSRSVYIPAGTWYDWYSPGKSYKGGRSFDIKLPQDHIPVFVKENSMFVTGENWLKGNSMRWDSTSAPVVVINAFPGKEDFSNDFVYMDRFDKDSLKTISINQTGDRISIHMPALGCDGKLEVYNIASKSAVVDGRKRAVEFNPAAGGLEFILGHGKEHEIEIEKRTGNR